MPNTTPELVAAAEEKWGDLALEIMEIALTKTIKAGEMNPQERIIVLLDSIYRVGLADGERRGITLGVKAACDTTDAILELMRPPHARS